MKKLFKLIQNYLFPYFPAESGEPSPYETKPFFPPELVDGDLEFSLLTRFCAGVFGEDRDLDCDLDLDRDTDGLLLREIECRFSESRPPRALSFSAGGERLRTGLLL